MNSPGILYYWHLACYPAGSNPSLTLLGIELDAALIRQYMDSTKHDFVSVVTIEEAQRILKDDRPDIFLVDIMIGGSMAYDLITIDQLENVLDGLAQVN